jgi:hypothetical protein
MSTLKAPVREARAHRVRVTEDNLVVDLNDGRSISAPLVWYPRLFNGTLWERNNWRLIADGEGIHWPDLDEDLSVDSLIAGRPSGESPQSLNRWLEIRSHLVSPPAFEVARNKYRPNQIKLLFIAEAPPSYDSRRFFYFDPVHKGDVLFLEMMKVLYPKMARFIESDDNRKPEFEAKEVRNHKAEFLEKFKRDGFYLIDAVDEPIPGNASTKMKEGLILSSLPRLKDKIHTLCGDQDVSVILIGAPVYNVCKDKLRNGGVRVLNDVMINMPAQGGQRQFRRKLGKLLSSSQITTSDSG